ncbi:sigma-70 family RNA polymerase sigma factor [Aquimarina celericrescens]|uniref:Sigma-70 family RNA polymerase sigma factor n=1 Tax=Aquimarina celericrescens TaxID=1964542 RepID=A0ABW5AWR0_9FLAO|nr:sigma-70 family RNA polymerase sigma factor [Aquimarina celericrescens]
MKIKKYRQASSIWLQFKDALKGYILKKTKNLELADEINQLVLMKVIDSCCSDVQIKNVRSWLFQIAHNTTIDYLKKDIKYVDLEKEIQEKTEDNVYLEIEPFVSALIDFLPEKYGVPLRMSDIEKLKQQDVADKLNLSLTATKSRIQRARELLKNEIFTCFQLNIEGAKGLNDIKLKDSCKPLQATISKNNQ